MDSAFKKLIYWSGHTHSLLGLAVHQLCTYMYDKKCFNAILLCIIVSILYIHEHCCQMYSTSTIDIISMWSLREISQNHDNLMRQ